MTSMRLLVSLSLGQNAGFASKEFHSAAISSSVGLFLDCTVACGRAVLIPGASKFAQLASGCSFEECNGASVVLDSSLLRGGAGSSDESTAAFDALRDVWGMLVDESLFSANGVGFLTSNSLLDLTVSSPNPSTEVPLATSSAVGKDLLQIPCQAVCSQISIQY